MHYENTKVEALEIIDYRGNPRVEVNLQLEDGTFSRAMVPSGASTGEREAAELSDGNKNRYGGKGVLKAVNNVNTIIAKEIENKCFTNQRDLDYFLIELDGTEQHIETHKNEI